MSGDKVVWLLRNVDVKIGAQIYYTICATDESSHRRWLWAASPAVVYNVLWQYYYMTAVSSSVCVCACGDIIITTGSPYPSHTIILLNQPQ